jgi:GntR family transcriptional regulator
MTLSTEGLLRVFPSSGVPIYRQLMDQVRVLGLSGQLRPGDLLPSVRSVATTLAINPMTVSKAYSALEAEGVVERVRGTGMRLCPQRPGVSARDRLDELRPLLEQVAAKAHHLALTRGQVRQALDPYLVTLSE